MLQSKRGSTTGQLLCLVYIYVHKCDQLCTVHWCCPSTNKFLGFCVPNYILALKRSSEIWVSSAAMNISHLWQHDTRKRVSVTMLIVLHTLFAMLRWRCRQTPSLSGYLHSHPGPFQLICVWNLSTDRTRLENVAGNLTQAISLWLANQVTRV